MLPECCVQKYENVINFVDFVKFYYFGVLHSQCGGSTFLRNICKRVPDDTA